MIRTYKKVWLASWIKAFTAKWSESAMATKAGITPRSTITLLTFELPLSFLINLSISFAALSFSSPSPKWRHFTVLCNAEEEVGSSSWSYFRTIKLCSISGNRVSDDGWDGKRNRLRDDLERRNPRMRLRKRNSCM